MGFRRSKRKRCNLVLQKSKPPYNTVSSIIRILETKEFVNHR